MAEAEKGIYRGKEDKIGKKVVLPITIKLIYLSNSDSKYVLY